MKHEKIIKREDGTFYRIDIHLSIHMIGDYKYRVEVWAKKPRKRTWFRTCNKEDYTYCRLSMEERRDFETVNNTLFVTEDEILEAKCELWEKLKPI